MAAMNPVVTKKILDNMDTKEKMTAINGEGKSAQQIALDKLAQTGSGATVAAPSGAVDTSTGNGYAPSESVTQALNNLNSLQKPGEYTSPWQQTLNDVMDKIMNREKFSYDLNGDALYQQYKNQYMTQGQQAMMDTMGQAAALTGGYGNSYAQSVGQQTYQGYLQGLNDKVPELYQLALDQYNREGDELYNQYGLISDRENTEYGRYRDTVSDYYTDRDYLTGRYDSERDFDYGSYRDTVADSQWQEQFDYQKDRDAVSDQQWQTEFDEGVRQFDTNVALTKEEMAIQQQQWQADYDLKVKEADRNYELTVRQIEEDVRHNKITEEQAQQQIALAKEELAQEKELAEKELAYKYAEIASEERQTNAKIQAEKAATKKKVEEEEADLTEEDVADWTGEKWANYFDQIRMYEYDSKTEKYVPRTNLKEGEAEALAELKELTSKGLIPKNYVSVASSAARGGKMGH